MHNIATLPAPRNAWYVGAWSHEVTEKPLARTILNERVVLFRDRAGQGGGAGRPLQPPGDAAFSRRGY